MGQLAQHSHGNDLWQQVFMQQVCEGLMDGEIGIALHTHVLVSSQSHLSVGRKMGLVGPEVWLSCRRGQWGKRGS